MQGLQISGASFSEYTQCIPAHFNWDNHDAKQCNQQTLQDSEGQSHGPAGLDGARNTCDCSILMRFDADQLVLEFEFQSSSEVFSFSDQYQIPEGQEWMFFLVGEQNGSKGVYQILDHGTW